MKNFLQNRTLNNIVALSLFAFDGWLALSTNGTTSVLFGVIAGVALSSLIMINLLKEN